MRDGSSNVECRMSSKYGYSGKSGQRHASIAPNRTAHLGQHTSWPLGNFGVLCLGARRPKEVAAHPSAQANWCACICILLATHSCVPFLPLSCHLSHTHKQTSLSLSLSIAVCARSSARLHSRFCDLSLLVTLRRTRTLLESEQPSKRVRPVGFGLVTRLSASPISLALCRLFTSR